MTERIEKAIIAWDERCDLDYRCPQAGRFPRSVEEFASWAQKYGQDVVDVLRAITDRDVS